MSLRPRAARQSWATHAAGRVASPGLGALAGAASRRRRARGRVSVALVSDARVRALNRRTAAVTTPTDVLSVSRGEPRATRASGPSAGHGPSAFLGDIVIARGVARRQARAAGHSELTELRVLALHGLLHLLGYDHERDDGRDGAGGAAAAAEGRPARRADRAGAARR